MAKFTDLTGQIYGRLKVIEFGGYNNHKAVTWKCICECGKEVVVRSDHLRYGRVQSCGCIKKETTSKRGKDNQKHGMWNTRIYHIWQRMKQRCDGTSNSNNKKSYFEKGIRVCDEWKESFETFYDWAINNGYDEKLSIDRIDNSKGYCPENCHWVSMKEQSCNRRNNRLITYKGKTQTVSEWAVELGIKPRTLHNRLYRSNMDVGLAFKKDKLYGNKITYKGETKTVSQWAKIIGLSESALYQRVFRRNMPLEKAFQKECRK